MKKGFAFLISLVAVFSFAVVSPALAEDSSPAGLLNKKKGQAEAEAKKADRDVRKQAKEADKEARKKAKEAEKEARKKQKEADKEARKQAKEAQKAAEKAKNAEPVVV